MRQGQTRVVYGRKGPFLIAGQPGDTMPARLTYSACISMVEAGRPIRVTPATTSEDRSVQSRWNDAQAGSTPLDQLVYMSRVMGEEEALVVWGGGNTSVKVEETDLLGRPTKLMLIKGTGSDMKVAQPKDFP